MAFETRIALRYLGSRKKNHFISVITVISCAGVAIGVWALIVVLAVMAGFEGDLRGKILETYAHLLVDRKGGTLSGYQELVPRLREAEHVKGVSPFLRTEVMISSLTNLSGVTLKGVRSGPAGQVNRLATTLTEGRLEYLDRPEDIPAPSFGSAPPPPPRRASPPNEGGGGEEEPGQALGNARPGVAVERGVSAAGTDPDAARPAAPAGSGADDSGTPDAVAGAAAGAPAAAAPLMPPLMLDAPATRRVLPGVLIGTELKKNLLVLVGDEVTLLAPLGDLGPTGPIPRSRTFRVAGVFYTGMYEYDSKMVYVTLPAAQAFVGARSDEVSGVELRADDPEGTPSILAELRALLAGRDLRVRDWRELNKSLFAALLLEKVAMFVILTLVTLVASFNIVASLIMVVLEKKKEVAILKALGTSDGSIRRIFVTEGLLIGVIGMVFGVLAGVATCLVVSHVGIPLDQEVYYIDRLPVELHARDIILVAASAVGMSLLATLYPARLAARLPPAEGLRHE